MSECAKSWETWTDREGYCCLTLCNPTDCSPPGSSVLQPQGLQPARLLCLWDFPSKNTGVGCHFLLQGFFSTQGSNLHPLHLQWDFFTT